MILYHYTTIGALAEILKDSALTFHISHYDSLNDMREYQYFRDGIRGLLEHYDEEADDKKMSKLADYEENNKGVQKDYYILSLSTQKDSLPMWRMYGEECAGVAIGINVEEVNGRLTTAIMELIKGREQLLYTLMPVIYGVNHPVFKDNLNNLYRACQDVNIPFSHICSVYQELIDSYAIYCKDPYFSYEAEWRIAVASDGPVRYKVVNGILRPFLELSISKAALREIVLGPSNNNSLNVRSLEMLLKDRGYDGVNICQSKIPYRR